MIEPKNMQATVSKFDEKLHKLIKRAKKERGLLWPAVVSNAGAGSRRCKGDDQSLRLRAEMNMIKETKFLRNKPKG